jgi:hypothetical protein
MSSKEWKTQTQTPSLTALRSHPHSIIGVFPKSTTKTAIVVWTDRTNYYGTFKIESYIKSY